MSAGSLRGQVAEIGQSLREARMRARIDITEVERATKIRARYLRAIENEEWEALPGHVYVKSFLRTYADYLGLDSRLLVEEYKRRYERPSDHELRPVSSLHRERERAARGPLLPPWLLIGAVLVAIVVVLWIVGSLGGGKKPSNSTPAATPPRHTATTTVTTHTTAAPPPPPRLVTLQLVPTGQVYVCLFTGDGKALIAGQIFGPGQTVPTERARKLLLVLGNNSVQMKVNGKVVPVSASANAIGLELTPTSTAPLPAARQPHCA